MRVRLNVQRLQDFLAKSALSQNHWAMRLGFSRGHWSDLVNGRHPYPSPKTRLRMVEVLGVPADDLFIIESGPTTWHDTDFRAALQDRYLIERELGQGAMGAVYVALDVAHNRRVAVKVLAPEAVCGIGHETFLREIGAVSRLHHPNILPLFDSGVVAEHPFFVMPLVRGGSLESRLSEEKRIDLASALAITRGVAAALTHTHRDFLLHCDVKPANILLHGTHAWLADFGISRALHAEVSEWRARKGIDVSAGTPAYVSPEQALGEADLDGRTDTYSLGCVVYEMLTGRPPFEGTTTEAIVSQRFVTTPRPLTELAPDVPHAVADVIAHAMEIDRDKRPTTPDAFAEALADAALSKRTLRTRVTLPVARAIGAARRSAARRPRSPRWDALWQDTLIAARRMLREPLVTAFILTTLALGIGMNVATFSIADRVLLRGPAHVREPSELVRVYRRINQGSLGPQTAPWLPYSTFTALRDGMRTTQAVAAYRVDDAMVGTGAAADMRRVSAVSTEMFELTGVHLYRGRSFGPGDANVAVVSERYWRGALGGAPNVIGSTLAINDVPHQVIGIAPAGFSGVELGRVDVWRPITPEMERTTTIVVVARRQAGATMDAVTADIQRIKPQIDANLPTWGTWVKNAEFLSAPIRYDNTAREPVEAALVRWLAAISAITLLITCANVANLLLARLARRRRELAVRVALGSGRMRVVRLLALEGLLLATGAAVAAVGIVLLVQPIVQRALFPTGAWEFSLIDARVIGAVVLFTLLAGVLVSIAPAIQAGSQRFGDLLKSGTRAGEARSPIRSTLTVVQAALSVLLLVGAGLFVRSLDRVRSVDLGLEPDRVLTVLASYPRAPRLPGESFGDWLARSGATDRARYQRLVEIARRVPGVERAAISVGVPFQGSVSQTLWIPGRDSVATSASGPFVTAVGNDYFATIGTPIREGRAFTEDDRQSTEPVVIVNQAMARALWYGRAIGECVRIGGSDRPCSRVVGVASDIHRTGLSEEPSLQLYVPVGQERGFSGSWLLVRPRSTQSVSWPALREALHAADPEIRGTEVKVLSDALAGQVRPFELGVVAFGLSALLALVVAGLGLYSIMAHAVAWRRHEIGVRLALGARAQSIATLIVGRGTLLASIGIGAGIIIAIAARRWVEPLLFNTSGADPLVLIGVVVLLEAVALLAGWLPARRAAAVSPTEALRAE